MPFQIVMPMDKPLFYQYDLLKNMSIKPRPWQSFAELIARGNHACSSWQKSVAMVVVVGIIDYITGYEVTIFPFYAIPILFALWFDNWDSAVVISVLSTIYMVGGGHCLATSLFPGMASDLGCDHATDVFLLVIRRRLGCAV